MSCSVPAAPQPSRAPESLEHMGLTWFIPVMGMWSLSFPLAAFASLSLRVGQAGWLPQWVGLVGLVLASVVISALVRWTFWGLRSGDLLQPEPGPAPKP